LQTHDPCPNDLPEPAVELSAESPGAVVVSLRGEHDLNSRAAVAAAVERACEGADVLVDLTHCAFIDSTVIGVLVATLQSQSERGRRLELVVPADAHAIRRVAEVAGLATFMPVHETRADGIASICRVPRRGGD
jgi:anti-anti-sigma factor